MLQDEQLVAYRRAVSIAVAVIILYLSFLIIRPFIVAIIGAAVLAYLFYPVYKSILKKIPAFLPAESLAALLTVMIIILIVLIPLAVVYASLDDEIRSGYYFLQNMIKQPDFNGIIPAFIKERLGILYQYKTPLISFAGQSMGWLQGVLRAIPNVIFSIFVTIFCLYFFLKGGKNINTIVRNVFPLPEQRYKQIFAKFDDISRSMILGQILVGILQGFLAFLGFWAFGVPNPVLWGFMTAIISVIPMLGAAMVWFPIVIYLFIKGSFSEVYWPAFALLAWGFLVVSTIDNFLKPKIVGDRAGIHPLIIFFGILGGIPLMGLPGILIGPLVLALFEIMIDIFREVV
ncbi:MAG: AI-2E family transporter [Candidatus Margulisbacteria bacterium]|nr:AI-2E family transporter [Candidatus Margulisiibacteriota bacterium]